MRVEARLVCVRILLTGSSGFIGSHIGQCLEAAGHEVTGLDCLHPAAHGNSGVGGNGDIRDPAVVRAALRGVDAVCHQAAMVGMGVDMADAPEYVSCNDLGTAVVLAEMAAAKVKRLVLASSMVVYGEGAYECAQHGSQSPAARSEDDLRAGRFEPGCPLCAAPLAPAFVAETAPLEPRSVYAATKLAQEHLAAAWARATGATATALRYHNVYGPHMPRDTPYAGVAAIFRSALERGQPPQVFEDGGQRRDFIHVRDVAHANLLALENVDCPKGTLLAYNIATGEPRTILEMATTLSAAMGGPAPQVSGRFRAGDVRHVTASPEQARKHLGFTAAVAFGTGVAEFGKAPLRS
jgi:dTDP-L-rhamnose 4-epimerase